MVMTLEHLRKLVPTLDDHRFEVLKRRVLALPRTAGPDYPVERGQPLLAWVFEWLMQFSTIVSDYAATTVTSMSADVLSLQRAIDNGTPDNCPVFRLRIAESRYATWPGRSVWLDIWYGEETQLRSPQITEFVCDVTALYLSREQWRAKHQHHVRTDAGKPGGPAPRTTDRR